ncbi:hypothetical protein [Legionella maceachernii]|uniref:hypothetical protein n=1 Tax=Legionella maceachernii TaxID=466 RepID=UPI000E048FE4|nr:hypothetical protein [Legionella maceachernii]SUP01268.1 Uncharacterised protein [Legionella maceachernii]
MELLPRVGRSFALLRMTVSCVVVLSEAKDLLGGVSAKSREVPRFARDDSCVVVLSEAKDLLGGVTAKSWEVPRIARDDRGCCRPERSEGSPGWGYCQELGGPSLCSG